MSNTIEFKLTGDDLYNISFYFICNVLDNIKQKDIDGDRWWGKEDASELIAGAIDSIRTLDDNTWQKLRSKLLERYKGR